MKIGTLGEFGLIDMIRHGAARGKGIVLGIGDDAAVLKSDRTAYQLFTTDMLVEGVHFASGTSGRSVGHKAMACNISDIAAMGGVPTFAVVSIGLRPAAEVGFVRDIYRGMERLARRFGVSIVGGDTVRSTKTIVNVALLGRVEKKFLVTRSGARPGDKIFVSGRLGRSLQTGRHLSFLPRLAEARSLVRQLKPTAMIDISDGLAGDLGHILAESRAGAVVEEKRIPRNKGATLQNALHDGEDFELLFTLRPADARTLPRSCSRLKFYEIGRITSQREGLQLLTAAGRLRHIQAKGFEHF